MYVAAIELGKRMELFVDQPVVVVAIDVVAVVVVMGQR